VKTHSVVWCSIPTMADDSLLLDVLHESQRFGALGETPEAAIQHSERFLAALGAASSVLDLGSGGGVPGLVLAIRRPDLRLVLLDRRTARTDLLSRLVHRLGVADRVSVLAGDAVVFGKDPAWREAFDAVVCRSFGTPIVSARMASPFLPEDGVLVVSEPPGSPGRWSSKDIARFGLIPIDSPGGLQVLRKHARV
jgi:16S rRNA (guanine527-N7)-methyltransferase